MTISQSSGCQTIAILVLILETWSAATLQLIIRLRSACVDVRDNSFLQRKQWSAYNWQSHMKPKIHPHASSATCSGVGWRLPMGKAEIATSKSGLKLGPQHSQELMPQ
jgi:hypothetical protein